MPGGRRPARVCCDCGTTERGRVYLPLANGSGFVCGVCWQRGDYGSTGEENSL